MRGVGIPDILRQMREIDVLVGKMQQMPRALPRPEGTEADTGLLLEEMQETRWRQPDLRGAACRRHRLAGKPTDLRDRSHHAGIERALRQRFPKTHDAEFGISDIVATTPFNQLLTALANP